MGLVTHRALLRLVAEDLAGRTSSIPVERIMQRQVVTAPPETPVLEAMQRMRQHKVSGLPVVDGEGRLVGIITERDLMDLAGKLLEEALAGDLPRPRRSASPESNCLKQMDF